MVFVADDLGAWLVFILAEEGRKKLTTLVFGSEQERALRSAATAAVQRSVEELRPDDAEQAELLAMVINQVFGEPVPGEPLANNSTVLEAVQAGIAQQLAVLDDASLTCTGRSSAEVLRIPGATMASKLTGHLLLEIVIRGSRGGPLEPLANQLNHDMTHLQSQRIEAMLGQLAGQVRDAMARLDASDRHGESSALAERRVDGYTAILRFLHGLNASVQRVADCVMNFAQSGWSRARFENFIRQLDALDEYFEMNFRQAREQSYVYGSQEAVRRFIEVYREYMNVWRDTALLEGCARLYLADSDPEPRTSGMTEAVKAYARDARAVFKRLEGNIEDLRKLLRNELGLAD